MNLTWDQMAFDELYDDKPPGNQKKYRRDELARVLRSVLHRVEALSADPGAQWALDRVADAFELNSYSDPLANYNYDGQQETSELAALRNFPKSGTQRARVLESLWKEPGMDYDVAARLHIPRSSAGPRRLQLVQGGWVQDSGRTRITENDCEAIVWKVTEYGNYRIAKNPDWNKPANDERNRK